MPRSPTSSEDEMAQSCSDSTEESESDSSKGETIYDTIRATAQKPGGARAEEGQAHTLVLRIVIEDLQQTSEAQRPLDSDGPDQMPPRCPLPSDPPNLARRVPLSPSGYHGKTQAYGGVIAGHEVHLLKGTIQPFSKCIRFNPDATVWVAKQRILCSLNQSLKDVLNYGLFQPASNGRDGKFLDEERLLREYPQPMGKGIPSLEFRYKKRVYRQTNLDEKQLAKLHTKNNLKKCMDHIQHRSVEKIVKMLDRGLDPNFHDLETGAVHVCGISVCVPSAGTLLYPSLPPTLSGIEVVSCENSAVETKAFSFGPPGFGVGQVQTVNEKGKPESFRREASAGAVGFSVPSAEAASWTQGPRSDDVECCLCSRFGLHVTVRVTAIVSRVARARLGLRRRLGSAETPLTLAAQLDDPAEMIKALRNGGAHLDFRAKDGMTALHKAARTRNLLALKTLLELGASPDYKDSYGLTPLYHTAVVGGDPCCCELLLHEHAAVSCKDENGWHEIHQTLGSEKDRGGKEALRVSGAVLSLRVDRVVTLALSTSDYRACRYGHVQHLEHLLFYGADMGAQNASGNTALHICALYNQDSCARVLLFRGGDKELKNYNSQTPFQVAIIAGNFELAEYIKNHKETDVVPLVPTRRTVPAAPPLSRRPAGGWAQSCILEEPSGLFPPALGLHRTCSGEQAHWTSSDEPMVLAAGVVRHLVGLSGGWGSVLGDPAPPVRILNSEEMKIGSFGVSAAVCPPPESEERGFPGLVCPPGRCSHHSCSPHSQRIFSEHVAEGRRCDGAPADAAAERM
ncbi:hypothetical protein MG293_020096 [Ovis ammon polii]|uniref:SH3 and multiple ankyrin repeat domains protein 3 n=1 Tax=Ovis ammon polii TaxID=230172 RepID=A0AAD4TRF0_OVIAM|nr:hypothetical protein MG293_020096 [Ovis ammon polii]